MIGDADPVLYIVCLLVGLCGGEVKNRVFAPAGGEPGENCSETIVEAVKAPLRPQLVAIAERETLEQEGFILLLLITIIILLVCVGCKDGSSQGTGRSSKRVSVSSRHPLGR